MSKNNFLQYLNFFYCILILDFWNTHSIEKKMSFGIFSSVVSFVTE